MIPLDLMVRWFGEVDDTQHSIVADQIASRWFGSDARVECGPASSNIVCRVSTDGQTYYLRCNYEVERSREMYEGEMQFVEHLGRAGIRVARPVGSRDGSLVERVPTPIGTFHAVVLESADGDERKLTDIDARSLHAWGRAMGEMHTVSRGYVEPARPSWREHLDFARSVIPAAEKAARRELEIVSKAMVRAESLGVRSGLVHFDMEADNMRWQDDLPTVFDFDDCAYYPLAADIAYALRDLYEDRIERIDLNDARLRAFVEGYRSVAGLPESELLLLPLFVRAHNLFWFARLQRAISPSPTPSEPAWSTQLRAKLEESMQAFRAGFESHPIARYLP